MPRRKRKKLKFTEESLNDYMQELYEDSYNIRAQIIRLFNKWEKKVKDEGHVNAMGESVIKLINALSKNQDQKIVLLRYLKEIVMDKNDDSNNDGDSNRDPSEDERNSLISMVNEELKKNKNKN